MGIEGLNKFIEEKFPDVYKFYHLKDFSYKKIAMDVASYIYKYIHIYGKENNNWLNPFLNLICLFRKYYIHTIFIFDGKPPKEKDEERNERRRQREKHDEKCFRLSLALSRYERLGEEDPILLETQTYLNARKSNKIHIHQRLLGNNLSQSTSTHIDINLLKSYLEEQERANFEITPEDISMLQHILKLFKIPFITAPQEAEALACYLTKRKITDTVFSLDSDCIAYGTPIIINNLDTTTGVCRVLEFSALCEAMEFDYEQLLLFCILSGCDFNKKTKKIKGIGPVTAYKLVQKYKDIETIRKNDKRFQNEQDDGLRYEKCVEIFKYEFPQVSINETLWNYDIDKDQIESFIKQHNLRLTNDEINQLWKKPTLYFEESPPLGSADKTSN